MSLTIKRYRYLILLGILFLWVLIYFWTYRIISINIWNKWEVTTDYFDIENTIDLFDTTQVHEIKILMTQAEYQDMINTYASISEKDWYRTDIIIDWVTIYNVWIRLKWNSSLWWMWWENWGRPSVSGIDRGRKWWFSNEKNRIPWNHWNIKRWWMSWFNFSWVMNFPWAFEWWSFWPWMNTWDKLSIDSQLPLFIKFNKYENQTYQWHEKIALRVAWMWSDETLLSEPYTYKLYQESWQSAPDASYWSVEIAWKDNKLFLVSEVPEDKYYIQKRFWEDNWIMYKAWNFVDFGYLWEDPTLYSDYFTQKTRVNDYDLSPLIRMLKFVTESDDEEFEEKIDNYIDVKSVLTLLAIDSFIWNNDSFGWMWSNYYLYYHLWEQRFYLLTWDQNLAFGGMWWGFGWWGWFGWGMWEWLPWTWWNKQFWTWDTNMPKSIENIPDFWSWAFEWFNPWEWIQTPPDFQWWEMWWFPWWDFPWGGFTWGEFPGWEKWDFPWWNNWDKKWWFGNWSNTLKTRLLANEKFKAMYDEIYAQIEEIALNSDFSENFFNEWTNAFNNYNWNENLVSKSNYSQWLEKLKSYLENKKS